MLDPGLTPTRLLHPSERAPLGIVSVRPPPSFLAIRTALRFLGWAGQGFWLRVTAGKDRRRVQARRLHLLLDELGGFWIKVGQLISTRTDIFSAELCEELSLLQDRAAGFSFEAVRQIIEAELGASLTNFFDAFDETPFAAASIGQIHKAHLRHENVWAAVKVQRPFVAETVKTYLLFVRRLVRVLEALSIWPHARWRDGYWELEHILQEEIDYRFESSNIRRIRKSLRRHNIYVPKVFHEYTTQRLLIMEFIEGVLMADWLHVMQSDPGRLGVWLVDNNIDQQLVARRLSLSMLRQMLEDNLYHGDLHPGNIILLRDSRIAFIDCGTVGFLELEYLDKFRLFLRSLFDLDYDKAADMIFLLSASLPVRTLDRAKEDLVRALRAWGGRTFVEELAYKEKSVANAWQECSKVYFDYKCTFSWQLLRIVRAMTTLDASLMQLYPEVNSTQLGREYFRLAERRTMKRKFGSRKALRQTVLNLGLLSELPEKAAELAFFYSTLARRQVRVFEGATSKVANLFAVLFGNLELSCAVAGLMILLVLLDRHAPQVAASVMGGVLHRAVQAAPKWGTDAWLLVLALDTYLGWTFARLRQRFRQSEVYRANTPSDT
jgi:ubiquinone biosynthesis protein